MTTPSLSTVKSVKVSNDAGSAGPVDATFKVHDHPDVTVSIAPGADKFYDLVGEGATVIVRRNTADDAATVKVTDVSTAAAKAVVVHDQVITPDDNTTLVSGGDVTYVLGSYADNQIKII